MLESFHFHRGPSIYGITYQLIVYMYASSVNMFKNKIDKYLLVKAGYNLLSIRAAYTYNYYMSRLSISFSFLVYCHLRCSLDGNLVKSC